MWRTDSCELIPEPIFPAVQLLLAEMTKRVLSSPISNSLEFGLPGRRFGIAWTSASLRRDALVVESIADPVLAKELVLLPRHKVRALVGTLLLSRAGSLKPEYPEQSL